MTILLDTQALLDRLIIDQPLVEKIPFISSDSMLDVHAVDRIWCNGFNCQ